MTDIIPPHHTIKDSGEDFNRSLENVYREIQRSLIEDSWILGNISSERLTDAFLGIDLCLYKIRRKFLVLASRWVWNLDFLYSESTDPQRDRDASQRGIGVALRFLFYNLLFIWFIDSFYGYGVDNVIYGLSVSATGSMIAVGANINRKRPIEDIEDYIEYVTSSKVYRQTLRFSGLFIFSMGFLVQIGTIAIADSSISIGHLSEQQIDYALFSLFIFAGISEGVSFLIDGLTIALGAVVLGLLSIVILTEWQAVLLLSLSALVFQIVILYRAFAQPVYRFFSYLKKSAAEKAFS